MRESVSDFPPDIKTDRIGGSMMRLAISLLLLAAACHLVGCAAKPYRFADKPVVWKIPDKQACEIPNTTRYIRMDYYYKVLVRRPTTQSLTVKPTSRSQDVNALDHIPESSWYTPRLGYREVTAEELATGPRQIGPPQPPLRVVRAKYLGSNPGFIIADSRDRLYLVKFDPPAFSGIETTTAQIVNRLFWGFGYNVPEDYLYYLDVDDLDIDPTADIDYDDLHLVLNRVAPPSDGIYRTTMSLLLDGIYLGPIPDTGTRKDDPNDLLPHESRRILRALKVFGAFTNQTDIRIDNSLDVYVGQPGLGHVRHYLLDFGEAFGGHGASHDRLWDGFAHIFSFSQLFGNLFKFGLMIDNWEHLTYTPWQSVGAFEADRFDPATWKETYPYEPIRQSQADDDYWAAKIVASLTPEHLERLIADADYPEPGAAEYMLATLLKRQRKIIDYYFHQVTPVEFLSVDKGRISFSNHYQATLALDSLKTTYQIKTYNGDGRAIGEAHRLESTNSHFELHIDSLVSDPDVEYIRLDISTLSEGEPVARPAQFHFTRPKSGNMRILGVVH